MVIPKFTVSHLCSFNFSLPGAPYVEMNNKILRVRSKGAWASMSRIAIMLVDDESHSVDRYELLDTQELLFTSDDMIEYIKWGDMAMQSGYGLLPPPTVFDAVPRWGGSIGSYISQGGTINDVSNNFVNFTRGGQVTYRYAAQPNSVIYPTPQIATHTQHTPPAPTTISAADRDEMRRAQERLREDTRRLTRDRWNNGR